MGIIVSKDVWSKQHAKVMTFNCKDCWCYVFCFNAFLWSKQLSTSNYITPHTKVSGNGLWQNSITLTECLVLQLSIISISITRILDEWYLIGLCMLRSFGRFWNDRLLNQAFISVYILSSFFMVTYICAPTVPLWILDKMYFDTPTLGLIWRQHMIYFEPC